MKLVAIILTYNEELHLHRCINSVIDVCSDILIVDSYSTDKTVEIAKKFDVKLIQHVFVNQADQFNWALTQLETDTDWVLRIDADEYIDDVLRSEIKCKLPNLMPNINGVVLRRSIYFQGAKIRYGGLFPTPVIRLFRYGHGTCESRWMDEHILVDGESVEIQGEIIDNNLNSLTWWINKHNNYASREAIEMLNLEYKFIFTGTDKNGHIRASARIKRWIKNNIYFNMPGGMRAMAYFLYRYIFRLGFLDGRDGFDFHFLQGFWYRYLVDMKISEVKLFMKSHNVEIKTAIAVVLGLRL